MATRQNPGDRDQADRFGGGIGEGGLQDGGRGRRRLQASSRSRAAEGDPRATQNLDRRAGPFGTWAIGDTRGTAPTATFSYLLSWKQPTTRIGTSYVVPRKGYLLEFSKGYLELRTFSKNRPPGDWIRIAGNRLWRGFRTMPR